MYCIYYQAKVNKQDCWFLVAVLRSFEHLSFDRTLNKSESIFEFFVPEGMEKYFLQIMEYFIQNNIVSNLEKLPNRLIDPNENV